MNSMTGLWSKVNINIPFILNEYKKIAVVGLSPKPFRASHSVAAYLQDSGYQIVPVNPGHKQILGQTCYRSLSNIPDPVEVVDIFRRSEFVLPVVEEAIRIGARVVWMQSGIINEEAAQLALDAGLDVVMDACMKIEHARLF